MELSGLRGPRACRTAAAPKPRASLGHPALLEAVAEGMGLLGEHVGALERDEERPRGEETARAVEAITAIAALSLSTKPYPRLVPDVRRH